MPKKRKRDNDAGSEEFQKCHPRGLTEGACSMAVPAMNTRPRTSTLRMPSTHPAIRNANHG